MNPKILAALYPNGIPADAYANLELEVSVAERLMDAGAIPLAAKALAEGGLEPEPQRRAKPRPTRRKMPEGIESLVEHPRLVELYPSKERRRTVAAILFALMSAVRPLPSRTITRRVGCANSTFTVTAGEVGAVKVGRDHGRGCKWALPEDWSVETIPGPRLRAVPPVEVAG